MPMFKGFFIEPEDWDRILADSAPPAEDEFLVNAVLVDEPTPVIETKPDSGPSKKVDKDV